MKQSIHNILIAILSLVTFIGCSSFIWLNLVEINDATNNNPKCPEQKSISQPLTSTGDFLGFYAELAFLGVPFDIDVVSFSAFSAGSANLQGPWETFNYTISNQFSPTNTTAYNPQQKELVCLISDEQQLLEYEDFGMYSPNPLNVSPATASAPVFLNGTYYAIEIEDGGSASSPLYEADIVSFDYQTATFNSNLHLQYSASPNTSEFVNYHMSSATNRIDELYFLCGTNLVIVTSLDISNPAYCWIDLVPNNTANNYYSFAGIEFKNPSELLAIRNHWVNGNNTETELVQIDFDAATCTVSNISVLYDLKNNIVPYPNNLIVNLEYHSTTYDHCNELYYISTAYSDDFDSRLIEIDIQNQTHAEQIFPYYLFGIEWKQKPCPCVASFNVTQLDNCGSFSFTNTSTGSTPMTCQWDFDDPNSGANNTSNQCQVVHQFSTCGTYNIKLTINANGCIEDFYQTVVVTDNTPPIALCKNGVTIALSPSCAAHLQANDIDNGSFDNCNLKSVTVRPNVFSACGNYPVTLTATDWCLNTSVCNTTIQVVDNLPPRIRCPSDVYLTISSPDCRKIINGISWSILTDNCGTPTVTFTITGATSFSGTGSANGRMFNHGTSIVTYTATDVCGNTSTCSFAVVLECICTCPNLIQNPGFYLGAITGTFLGNGYSNNWFSTDYFTAIINTYNTNQCDQATIVLRAGSDPKGNIYQSGLQFKAGHSYKISFRASNSGGQGTPFPRLLFVATNSTIPSNFNPSNCLNCASIGFSPNINSFPPNFSNYSLPIWTPIQDWNTIFIQGSTGNSPQAISLDKICVYEFGIYKCCEDQETFNENVRNAINIYVDPIEEETILEIGNYFECNSIAIVDWGDGSDTTGPFGPNIQLRHQYPDSNKYEIKVTVQELDSSEQMCFETIVSDSAQVKMYTTKYIGAASESSYNPHSGITKWSHDFISRDKGQRTDPESSKYNLETALLMPIIFADPVIDVTDDKGSPVTTEAGEVISLVPDDDVSVKAELISPAPPGYSWKGYQSNLLTPTASASNIDLPFTVSFKWLDLPVGSQDSSGSIWISDNKDELYGEQILDGFGFFQPSALDTTTATNHVQVFKNIKLYPNPANDEVTINWGDYIPGDVIVEIIDCSGRILQKMNLESDILQSTIDVSMLEEGLYFIKILRGKKPVRVLKFVKAK